MMKFKGLVVLLLIVPAVWFAGQGALSVLAAGKAAVAAETWSDDEDDAGLCIEEKKVIALFKRCSPSVVFITNKAQRRVSLFSRNVTEIAQGMGSGFVWDRQGHVVTNSHVILGASSISVTLADGSEWEAKLVGYEPDKDLAVLKIDAPGSKLVPIAVGKSAGLEVGQTVLAIGNPFGLDHTLTKGIISAKGRQIQSWTGRAITDVIQTDAAINPGNSGGPLLDSKGRLIGVSTALKSTSGSNAGIGFAVPADTVNSIVPYLIRYGRVITPEDMGIELLSDSDANRFGLKGAVILRVAGNSVADRTGLEGIYLDRRRQIVVGDIIVGLDDKKVFTGEDLSDALKDYKPGDTVEFLVKRGRGQFRKKITLVKRD